MKNITPRNHEMLKHKLMAMTLGVMLVLPMMAQATYQPNKALDAQIAQELQHGDEADWKVLFGLYKKSAALGSAEGQIGLAKAYAYGNGTKQSSKLAIESLLKAIKQGDAGAMHLMGSFYDPANSRVAGIKADQKEAMKWYLLSIASISKEDLAANKGDVAWGLEPLAKAYETGNGVKQDGEKAIKFYRILSKIEGREDALINIGDIYRQGKIVPKDPAKAMSAYMEASKIESTYGDEYRIGDMYYKGEGVKQDYTKAFEWFRKAAAAGDVDGYLIAGKMLAAGTGVSKSQAVAKQWFELACDGGSEEGCKLAKR